MQIKFLEPFKYDGQQYDVGDVKTFADNIAKSVVDAGLAEDVSGTMATGTRTVSRPELVVADLEVKADGGVV